MDNGFPASNSSREATVTVRVQRNNNNPRFDREAYTVAIPVGTEVDSEVIKLNGRDSDSPGEREIIIS